MNISKQVVILSAEKDGDSIENKDLAIRTLTNCLKDCNFSFNIGSGVFNNGPEQTSFVVIVNNEAELQTLKDFAFKSFNQDAILYQDANQEAYLVHSDGKEKRLGLLSIVPKDMALNNGSYTLLDGSYYVANPRMNTL